MLTFFFWTFKDMNKSLGFAVSLFFFLRSFRWQDGHGSFNTSDTEMSELQYFLSLIVLTSFHGYILGLFKITITNPVTQNFI